MAHIHWLGATLASGAAIAIAIAGCAGDTINNTYADPFGADSGIDVQVLSTLGCSAGKKECVTETVARVCPADGTAWVAVGCRAGEKCTDGDCKPVAGGPTAACVPSDGACVAPNKAIRCKADGTGYEPIDCPAGTTCQDRGVCKGVFAVGESMCSTDRKSVLVSTDGYHQTTTACAAGEFCVNVATTPIATAACKPATCTPNISNSVPCGQRSMCGDPSTPTNDQTKYVASCKETPEGWKWVGTACTAGQTCNPVATNCTYGDNFEAACAGGCTPNTTRCSPNGQGVQTCQADGTWGAATQCNYAGGERCINLFNTTGKAVCGDPICGVSTATNGIAGICDDTTGGIRMCDPVTGKLKAAQTCTSGRCQRVTNVNLPPPQDHLARCANECTSGAEDCGNGGNDWRACENGRWSAPKACPSTDGAASTCFTRTDDVTGLSKHECVVGFECSPNTRRCASSDGGAVNDQIQTCGIDGKWQAAQTCALGTCSTGYSGGALCVSDCIPGQYVCDPTGSGKYLVCPANGKLPSSPVYDQSCNGTMACKRAGARSLGCIECAGPNLIDALTLPEAESRCVAADGGVGGWSMLQGCKSDNTWDTPVTCSGGANRCSSSYNTSPFSEPGGIRNAYCF